MHARIIIPLVLLAIVAPPVGLPLLLIYAGIKALGYAGRDGGILERRRMDAWFAQEVR